MSIWEGVLTGVNFSLFVSKTYSCIGIHLVLGGGVGAISLTVSYSSTVPCHTPIQCIILCYTSPHSGSVGLSSSLVGDGIASLVDTRSKIPRMKKNPGFPREEKERKKTEITGWYLYRYEINRRDQSRKDGARK